MDEEKDVVDLGDLFNSDGSDKDCLNPATAPRDAVKGNFGKAGR